MPKQKPIKKSADTPKEEVPEEKPSNSEEEEEKPLEPLKLPFQKEADDIKAVLSHIKHKIIVSSGKGGVGENNCGC